jgi:hypothetical protein
MPMDRSLYPVNWNTLASAIKTEVGWTCEDCGRPCRRPGEDIADFIERTEGTAFGSDLFEDVLDDEHGIVSIFKRGRFTLTVAHLDHIPAHCDRSNLRAWCAPCHCRYDIKAMATKRRLKLEREGQLTLFQ